MAELKNKVSEAKGQESYFLEIIEYYNAKL